MITRQRNKMTSKNLQLCFKKLNTRSLKIENPLVINQSVTRFSLLANMNELSFVFTVTTLEADRNKRK